MSAGNIPLRKYREIVAERGLALLEPAPLMALADDMGDPACAVNFLRDYLRMLPGRMARISTHLQEKDCEAAMDALLSLRVTSAMAGAQETERNCRAIEALIRSNRLQYACTAALSLESSVNALIAASQDLLIQARADLLHVAPAVLRVA